MGITPWVHIQSLGRGAKAGFGDGWMGRRCSGQVQDGQGMLKHAPAPWPRAAPLPSLWPATRVLQPVPALNKTSSAAH